MIDDTSRLSQLGSHTKYSYDAPLRDILEAFPNKYPDREYSVGMEFGEFTSLCPKTGQPDFAVLRLNYSPAKLCVESKSLKLYLFAFRNYGSFMETIGNKIVEDVVAVLKPRWLDLEMEFAPRGGISLTVQRNYTAEVEHAADHA